MDGGQVLQDLVRRKLAFYFKHGWEDAKTVLSLSEEAIISSIKQEGRFWSVPFYIKAPPALGFPKGHSSRVTEGLKDAQSPTVAS